MSQKVSEVRHSRRAYLPAIESPQDNTLGDYGLIGKKVI